MRTREEILTELQEAIRAGVVTESDLRTLLTPQPAVIASTTPEPLGKPEKLSAVDVMFYIAGVVLFSTIMSVIAQSWSDGSRFVHILLSAFIGAVLWSIASYLAKSPQKSEIREGLTNSLLLTGSLLLIVGGYIIINEIVGGYGDINFMPAAIALALLGGLHIGFDRIVKKDLILLMGVLLAVSTFPALLFGILQDSDMPLDVWSLILIASSGLLVYASRLLAKLNPERKNIGSAFDSFAAFIALLSMYIATYTDYGVIWYVILIAAVLGIFYLSIVTQNKHLLGYGSFFMVLTIITLSFEYFSGYGVTFSLIVATIGLLASAAVASTINKKYFKKPVESLSEQPTYDPIQNQNRF